MAEPHVVSREECLRLLRRIGFTPEGIDKMRAVLPDPVDFDRDADIFLEHGLTRDRLTDLMGGSP